MNNYLNYQRITGMYPPFSEVVLLAYNPTGYTDFSSLKKDFEKALIEDAKKSNRSYDEIGFAEIQNRTISPIKCLYKGGQFNLDPGMSVLFGALFKKHSFSSGSGFRLKVETGKSMFASAPHLEDHRKSLYGDYNIKCITFMNDEEEFMDFNHDSVYQIENPDQEHVEDLFSMLEYCKEREEKGWEKENPSEGDYEYYNPLNFPGQFRKVYKSYFNSRESFEQGLKNKMDPTLLTCKLSETTIKNWS